MFQPTNESFVRAIAEASIDRHYEETDEEYGMRHGRVSNGTGKSRRALGLFRSAGPFLLSLVTLWISWGRKL